jgi:hypothetical protein
MVDIGHMATAVHPVSNIVPSSAARALAPVAPWVVECLLLLIAALLSVAAFSAGYQIG